MIRTQVLQEIGRMRFKEAYGGWQERRLTQEEAARLLGVCERTFRRYVDRYEEEWLDGLVDKRLSQVSARRAPVDEVVRTEALYRERYDGWIVQHFYSFYRREHAGARNYSWVKNTLQRAGLVAKAPRRGKQPMKLFVRLSGTGRCVRRFLGEDRAGATALAAVAVTIMTVGGAALIIDHVWIVGQRDTLKAASNAAGIATTLEMNRVLADDPAVSDDSLKAALQPAARRYVIFNLLHLSVDRYERALDTLVVEVEPDRNQRTVNVTAQADLGGFLFAPRLPLLSGVNQIESIETGSRVESMTNPVEVVLAIDVSGSMARDLDGSRRRDSPDSRINIVKQAARELVAILNPNETNRVAIGVVPWHFVVRLHQGMREDWERKGWAAYPQSRHYAAMYDCRPEPGCRSMASDQNLPARAGSTWNGCLDEHRVSLTGNANIVPVAHSLNLPSDTAFALAFYPASYGIAYQCMSPPLPSDYQLQNCYTPKSVPDGYIQVSRPPQYGCDNDAPSVLPLTSDH